MQVIDPVLMLHRAHGRHQSYTTVGIESPASVRDQVLRSTMIVRRAARAKLITGQPDEGLLIEGVGAGGAAAALAANELGINVFTIDQEAEPFSLQRGCSQRFIDPLLYDWPAPRADESSWTGNTHLGYSANFADQVINDDFDPRFKHSFGCSAPRRIVSFWNATLASVKMPLPGLPTIKAEIDAGGPTNTNVFCSMILRTTGAGTENVQAGSYRGPEFWEDDKLLHDPLLPKGPAKVLISGAGDGALQDLIRVMANPARVRSPRDLWEAVKPFIEPGTLRTIAEAEDQSQRSAFWAGADEDQCLALLKLRRSYEACLDDLVNDPARWKNIADAIHNLLRVPLPQVTLVHPCKHFNRCFALNQFIALLLLRLIPKNVDDKQGLGLVHVKHPSHSCADFVSCHGLEHNATVQARHCGKPASPSQLPLPDTFNIVIVRHGMRRAHVLIANKLRVPLRRQWLPHELEIP